MKADNKIIITPGKPIIVKGLFGCMIKLKKNQINYGNLKSRKELKGFREQINRHITIIGGKTAEKVDKIFSKFSTPERNKKIAELKTLLKDLKWQHIQKEIYFVNQKSKKVNYLLSSFYQPMY